MEMHTAAMLPKSGKTALIVDDNAAFRAGLRELFLSDGFETCAEAANGKEGIRVASECQPDVIILDLSMPVMNGLEAAPVLRKLLPNTPIILFTFHSDILNQQNLSGLGVTAMLSKTDGFDSLLQKTRELLNP